MARRLELDSNEPSAVESPELVESLVWSWGPDQPTEQECSLLRSMTSLVELRLRLEVESSWKLTGRELDGSFPPSLKNFAIDLDVEGIVDAEVGVGSLEPPGRPFGPVSEIVVGLLVQHSGLETLDVNFDLSPESLGRVGVYPGLKSLSYLFIYADAALDALLRTFPNLTALVLKCNPFDFRSDFLDSQSEPNESTRINNLDLTVQFAPGEGSTSENVLWVSTLLRRTPNLESLKLYTQFHGPDTADKFFDPVLAALPPGLVQLTVQFDEVHTQWDEALVPAVAALPLLSGLKLNPIAQRETFTLDHIARLFAAIGAAQSDSGNGVLTVELGLSHVRSAALATEFATRYPAGLCLSGGRRVTAKTTGPSRYILRLDVGPNT